MGVVIKQSFWGTFISYLGVIIGYVNTLYLKPEFLDMQQIGLMGIIPAHAMLISPFCSLGMGSSFIRFFPNFEGSFKNQLFTFQLLFVVAANLLVLIFWHIFYDEIASFYAQGAPEYIKYLTITALVIVANSLFDFFFSYNRALLKIIMPSFLRDVYLKSASMILVLGYAFDYLSFDWAIKGLAFNYLSAVLFLYLQLIYKLNFRLDFDFSSISRQWKIKIFNFAAYSMLLAGTFAILNNVTYNQVTAYLGSAANGIFTTCFFIGTIVELPKRNMAKVIAPIISEASEKGDSQSIKSIYKKASITMSVIGSLLFIGITTNLGDLFDFIPRGSEFISGFSVVIGVCLAKLSLMIASFPAEIINFSKHYRFNLLFQASETLMLVALNYYVIQNWGLDGVAFSYPATIITLASLRVIFVRYWFGFTPFTKKHVSLLVITLSLLLFFFYFQLPIHPILTIIVRSVLTSVTFILFIYLFKISPDINSLIKATFKRILNINLPG